MEQYCLTLSTEEETTENYGIIRNMQREENLTNFIIRVAISRSTIEILFLTQKFSGKQLTSKRGLLLAK